jgi:RNA polymerase sigma-70 factor (ECF subfamily)
MQYRETMGYGMTTEEADGWLDAARHGDEVAVAHLFRAVYPGLLHYLRQRAPGVAEDLASEAWMAAAKRFAQFEGGLGDFRALLFLIARRRVADHYRAQSRRPRLVALDQAPEPAAVDVAETVVGEMSTSEAIRALVQALPADQAEVVLLRVVGGLSVEQAATAMGRSQGAVRALQHRALRRLSRVWTGGAVTR